MKRLHVHVAVKDFADNVSFYSSLFGADPSVLKTDYAKWALEDPRVNFAISTHCGEAGVDHLGIQVEGTAELAEVGARLRAAGRSVVQQNGATCCYAKGDKGWVKDPQGVTWETFFTSGASTVFGEDAMPSELNAAGATACCAAEIAVFDPPMCCSTGVCGPSVDPQLARFAADLDWLRSQGVKVERYNLSQAPGEFAANAVVKKALEDKGNECLPLVLVGDAIVSSGTYPDRDGLARLAGMRSGVRETIYSEAVAELVAIGAAIAANCEPCFKFHFDRARKLGVSREDMGRAVATAKGVKETPARAMAALAERLLNPGKVSQPATSAAETACCSSAEKPSSASPASNGATSASCCGGGSERSAESASGASAAISTCCGPDKASDAMETLKSAAGKCC
jgi:AhpD family alkylhydroperoxidase